MFPKYNKEKVWLGDKCIPAGSVLRIHVKGIHSNPKHWHNPDTFDPTRFMSKDWNKNAFIPFSDGIRACIGKRFAIIEATTVLSSIVKKYIITLANELDDEKKMLEPEIGMAELPKYYFS